MPNSQPSERQPRVYRLLAAVLLAPLLLHPLTAAAELNRWSVHGPNGGDVFALAVDPENPSTLYAGSAATVDLRTGRCEGAFRSRDGGDTWTPINRGLADSARCVAALLVDPHDPARLFAGTGEGIYRSSDGGDTWSQTPVDHCRMRSLAVDPRDPSRLFAGSDSSFEPPCGMLRSTDGGDTWIAINDGLADEPHLLPTISALAVDPADGHRLYAATAEGGIFRSLDGGDTWTLLAAAPISVTALVIDPADPDTLWADGYRSSDGGDTWENVFEGLAARVGALAFEPESGILYAASAERAFRSADGGTTWSPGTERLHTAILSLLAVPGSSTLFAGTLDSGVFRSADGGDSWAPSAHGPVTPEVLALAVAPAGEVSPAPVYAATDRGMYLSTDGGRRWMPRNLGLGGRWRILGDRILESITDFVIDPQNPTNLYLSTTGESGVYRSTDGGDRWDFVGLRTLDTLSLAIDPDTPQNLLAGTEQGIYRSTDYGLTWNPVLADHSVSHLGHAPAAPSRVFGVAGDLLLVSDDGGLGWAELAGPGAGTGALAVDPGDPFTLWAATGIGVWRSEDGGLTWTAGLLGLPEIPIRSLAIDPASVLYAGTDRTVGFHAGVGVYRSIDGGSSWWPVARGLPHASYRALTVDPRIGALYAGAADGTANRHDDGVYQIEQVPTLELQGGRFRVEVQWREYRDLRGLGHVASVMPGAAGTPVPLRSRDSAVLEFFGPDNWELAIKVLDGRALNDHFWVFFAAATNVGYTLTVTDTACGQEQNYLNILGRPAAAVTDIEAFPGCPSPEPPSCEADGNALCLGEDGRFRVDLSWHDFVGNTGTGRQAMIPAGGLAGSDDSGLFYFFGNDNWEVLVKVLDGCRFNNHFWVFSAATTDVEYQLTVTDTATGEVRTWFNPLGADAEAVTEVEAFATCAAAPVSP